MSAADPLPTVKRRLWRALLLCVPVSATPLLPFGNGTLARPLAIVPAVLLLGIAAYRFLVRGQRPRLAADGFMALALFTLYLVVGGLMVVTVLPPDAFKGQTPLDSLIRALLTWGVGLAFYVVARLQIRTAADIRLTLRTLSLAMGVSIAFAGVQVVAMAQHGELLRLVQAVTDLAAVRYDGLVNRAQGLTFEPSWLATQIIVLLIPALIARAMARQEGVGLPALPGHALRLAGGFAVAVAGLLFSGSRFGLACIVAMLGLGVFLAALRGRILAAAAFLGVLLASGGAVVAMSGLGAGAGATYVMGPVAYLTQSADLSGAAGGDLATGVTDALALAGRFAAAEAAGLTWLDHPAFGVSLGNNYRFFGQYAPDWAFATQLFTQGAKEGIGWLDPNSPEKGNAKNLFLRLLSETGLVGFVLFAVFFWRQLFRGRPHDAFHHYFRLVSAAALGFSFLNQDTFVDAGLWIPLALCCAMNHLPHRQSPPAGE
ncbi:O-antigen ligase family protein [Azospirillum sp. B4]|uniref:O-antigen ligase family protein n=1 Tax=Azospirillum sp. B4 TaxID=95605 RepID=UPI0003483706|nr:O-antigen ligase family protein [Azospirillum sp. B4]